MGDMAHILLPGVGDTQIFTSWSWQQWIRPRGATMVNIFCLGAGSGGGGGASANSSSGAGGSGGGSSSISKLLIPAMFLPEYLYVITGQGGAGAAPWGTGVIGGYSFVSTQPGQGLGTTYLVLGAGGGPGGGGQSTGGSAGTSYPASALPYTCLGLFLSLNGQTGGAAGTSSGTVGGTIAVSSTTGLTITGGAGGGGKTATAGNDYAGGDVTFAGQVTRRGGYSTAVPHGDSSLPCVSPLISLGGAGGRGFGGTNRSVGGNGGDGGYGAGGGGGGCGPTGGAGGRGGDGIVIITTW